MAPRVIGRHGGGFWTWVLLALAVFLSRGVAQPDGKEAERARLAAAALQVFTEHCARCHGPEAPRPKGGIGYLTDLAAVAKGESEGGKLVDLGRPKESRVYKTIVKGLMPRDAEKPLPPEAAAAVLAWIEAGAPPAPAAAPAPAAGVPGRGLEPAAVGEAIHADLEGLRKSRPERAANARYLTLAHLANQPAVGRERLEVYRRELAERIAALAECTGTRPLAPVAGTGETVFRLDLGELGWTAERWERLAAGYPYGGEAGRGPSAVASWTGTRLPVLRGDWFAGAVEPAAGEGTASAEAPARALREKYLEPVTLE